MWKKSRFLFWLAQAFIQRHAKTIFFASAIAYSVAFVSWKYAYVVRRIIFPAYKTIGVVGLYTPTNLPYFLQEKISIGLTQVTAEQQVKPAAAQTWDVRDEGKTFIFNLRSDLFWHDGQKFSANDVNYNFQDAQLTAINPQVLKIALNEPFSHLPSLLARPLFREGLIGLGQYRVALLKLQGGYIEEIVLKPVHTREAPAERVKFYPTLSKAITAFKLGEIQSLRTLDQPAELEGWGEYLNFAESVNSNIYTTILFKTTKAPFDQKTFRQALAYSIPDKLTGGKLKGPIPDNSWAYNANLKLISYDATKAQDLFDKTGVATQSAEFTLHTFHNLLDIANQLAQSWSELFNLKVNVKEVNTPPEDFSVLLTMYEIPKDPDQYVLWHSVQRETNRTALANPKIDKLLEDGRKTFDQNKRRELYAEFQRQFMEDLPALFLNHPVTYVISRK